MSNVYWEEDREYFECDCHDSNHLLRAVHSKTMDKDVVAYEEISLQFIVKTGDWEVHGLNKFTRLYRRLRWRFHTAVRILFFGWVELQDEWIPERRSVEQVRGKAELRRFIGWLAKKQIEVDDWEMKSRQFTLKELEEYKAFAEKWASYPISEEKK